MRLTKYTTLSSLEWNGVPEWCKFKNIRYSETPNYKIQNNREPPIDCCLKKTCLLCSPPSYVFVIGLFSFGSPIVDMRRVKTPFETGIPRSPKSDAPRGCLSPHYSPRKQPALATCSGQYLKRGCVAAEDVNRDVNNPSGRTVTAK